ncbi:inositol transporter-like SP family MFS transporter [Agromyces terreus]|uniref:Inositol transporter-like SP family MFS transporter n=1 Tax=Agromyces terreus TaxID=424795 RepID=A0A9X2K9U7_9MICO|nr:MFS transporter [Agromyces terreus]MCP2369623.1 inositol transporter-like SP family MFS transporter [Agromyces terreus]
MTTVHTASGAPGGTPAAGSTRPERVDWKRVILACMADYLDAGAIVAASAGLVFWTAAFGFSPTVLGLLAALGVNAGSYAVGALVGGYLGDKVGRKRVYQYDLLLYVLGALLVAFAPEGWVIFVGLIILGLAVGADVPTSWALIGEIAPAKKRGSLMGMTSIFWSLGPVVVLLLALALADLGLLGIRIVFAHLALVALITWILRRKLKESEMWVAARAKSQMSAAQLRMLFKNYGGRLFFVFLVHSLGAIALGTFGFFLPFILSTVGAQGQAASVGFNALYFGLTGIGVAVLFMPMVDRVNRRWLYGIAGLFTALALLMMIFLPLDNPWVVLTFVVVFALSASCGQEQLYRVWCQELFPTMVRSTAQGVIIFGQKVALAVWSLFVPLIIAVSFDAFAWVLFAAVASSVLIGVIWMPKRPDSLEEVGESEPVAVAA